MASLASKDTYLQKLGSKVCALQNQEPRKRPYVPFRHGGEAGAPKNKKRNQPKHTGGNTSNVKDRKPPGKPGLKQTVHPGQAGASSRPSVLKTNTQNGTALKSPPAQKGGKSVASSFFAVDILRQRLHEKIEETRSRGNPKGLSSEEVEKKRERRKQERERKKRKRKEFRMKKLAAKVGEGIEMEDEVKPLSSPVESSVAAVKVEPTMVFNKVEVGEEYLDKVQLKKEKKNKVKGNLTPLTGKNYKQLLSRVEARKAKLEELRTKDEGKAKEMEEKMKWTNVLYKAEGLKIKDNEDLLRASLKRKEKMRSQRKNRWDQRSENILEKMQHKQDKRRKNILKQKRGKVEKRKDKARKKGRVLPEDLKKA